MIDMNTMLGDVKKAAADMFTDNITPIDIDKLYESPDNPFGVIDVEELAEVIYEQGGVMSNLTVQERADGGYEIISGHRRTAAVRHLINQGRNVSRFLPCYIKSYSNEEEKKLDIILMNLTARTITDSELYKSYEIMNEALQSRKALGERFGRVRERLAEMLNISTGKVSQLQSIDAKASPAVKEALENGKISINTASELSKLDIEKQAEIVSQTPPKELTPKEIKNCAKLGTITDNDIISEDEPEDDGLSAFKTDYPNESLEEKTKECAKLGTNAEIGIKNDYIIPDPKSEIAENNNFYSFEIEDVGCFRLSQTSLQILKNKNIVKANLHIMSKRTSNKRELELLGVLYDLIG